LTAPPCPLAATPRPLRTGNHPLAGIALRLSLTVRAVRDATEEEIGSGTAGTGFFRITPMVNLVPGSDALH